MCIRDRACSAPVRAWATARLSSTIRASSTGCSGLLSPSSPRWERPSTRCGRPSSSWTSASR
eukprot:3758791-Pyramimonas_sp.AAC.1